MSETPRAKRTKRTKLPFEVWALVMGGFTVALGYGVVAPVLPQYAQAFGVSTFAASGIVSAFALMRLLFAPFAGWFVGKFAERTTYSTGILIVALSTGACALAVNYTQLLVLRGVGGIGSIMFTVAATALLIKVSPVQSRGRVASLNAAGFLSGSLLGPVMGGIVATFGLRAPFVFYFITLVIAASVVGFALRGSTLAARNVGGSDEPSMSVATAFAIPHYRVLLGSFFSFGWASFGVRVSVVPLFVVAAFDGGASMAAWVLAAYAAGNALLIFPAGRWSDTAGRKPLLIVGLVVLVITYFFFPASPTLWVALAIMVGAGAGSALVNPAQQAVLADIVGKKRGGTVVSTASMSADLGAVIGPLLAGWIVDLAGYGWAFGITAGLLVIPLIGWSLISDSRALQKQGQAPRGSANDAG